MNYSLSSTRKLGRYNQKIVTTWNDAIDISTTTTKGIIFTAMRAWHTAWEDADPLIANLQKGTIEYKGMIESPSEGTDNTGAKADGVITFAYKEDGKPQTVTVTVKDVTLPAQMTGTALGLLAVMVGNESILASEYYAINILITMHN